MIFPSRWWATRPSISATSLTCATGSRPRLNVVRQDGERGTLVTILKTGTASTLDVVSGIRQLLPRVIPTLPSGVEDPAPRRSVHLRAGGGERRDPRGGDRRLPHRGHDPASSSGSWRSTVIIAVSIPLSILTLGHRPRPARRDHQHHDPRRLGPRRGHPGRRRHRDHREHRASPGGGPRQRATPSSTARRRSRCPRSSRRCASASCSCPCSSSAGSPRYLFVPLAEAVIFAMIASYILSRTLVPTLAMYLLKRHGRRRGAVAQSARPRPAGVRSRVRAGPARPTATCSTTLIDRRLVFIPVFLAALPRRLSCWLRGSARTSSRTPTAGSSSCTCGPRAGPASRKRRG